MKAFVCYWRKINPIINDILYILHGRHNFHSNKSLIKVQAQYSEYTVVPALHRFTERTVRVNMFCDVSRLIKRK